MMVFQNRVTYTFCHIAYNVCYLLQAGTVHPTKEILIKKYSKQISRQSSVSSEGSLPPRSPLQKPGASSKSVGGSGKPTDELQQKLQERRKKEDDPNAQQEIELKVRRRSNTLPSQFNRNKNKDSPQVSVVILCTTISPQTASCKA